MDVDGAQSTAYREAYPGFFGGKMFGIFYVVLSAVSRKNFDLTKFFAEMIDYGYEFVGDMSVLGGVMKLGFKLTGNTHEESVTGELKVVRACAISCGASFNGVEVECRDGSLYWKLNKDRKIIVYDI